MKKGWKILIAVIVVLAVLVMVAKMIIGSQIKPIIEKEASKILGTPVHIGGIRIGFLTGDVGVTDFSIANPAGFSKNNLFRFDTFGVKLSYPALLNKQFVVNRIYVNKPEVNIEMLSPKKINVLALMANLPKAPKKTTTTEKPLPPFMVQKVTVSGGQLKVLDAAYVVPAVTHSIDNFNFELLRLTNFPAPPKDAGQFKLSALLNRKAPINISGQVSPFDKKVSFHVKGGIKDVNLNDYAGYFQKSPVAINSGAAGATLVLECLKEVLSGQSSVNVSNLKVGQKTGTRFTGGDLAGALTDYLKDNKGALAFDFPISGTLHNPNIGFMGALNRLMGNILGNVVRREGEKMVEKEKNKAIGEATKGIRFGF